MNDATVTLQMDSIDWSTISSWSDLLLSKGIVAVLAAKSTHYDLKRVINSCTGPEKISGKDQRVMASFLQLVALYIRSLPSSDSKRTQIHDCIDLSSKLYDYNHNKISSEMRNSILFYLDTYAADILAIFELSLSTFNKLPSNSQPPSSSKGSSNSSSSSSTSSSSISDDGLISDSLASIEYNSTHHHIEFYLSKRSRPFWIHGTLPHFRYLHKRFELCILNRHLFEWMVDESSYKLRHLPTHANPDDEATGYCVICHGHALYMCPRCRDARYCNETCQRNDWTAGHSRVCKKK